MMAGPVEGIVAAGILEGTGGGPVGVGGGWSSLMAWLVAAAAITVLAGAAWWIAGPSRRRSRRGSAQVLRFGPGTTRSDRSWANAHSGGALPKCAEVAAGPSTCARTVKSPRRDW